MQLAKNVGLDLEKFKTDLNGQAVKNEIAATNSLAKELKIYFTPVLIAANTNAKPKDMQIIFVPGQLSGKALEQMLAQVKKG